MKWLKRFYDWLLSWAETPYGGIILGIWTFAESSIFPIPPDPFLIALVLGARKKAFKFATMASVFSVFGGILGYGIGYYLWWTNGEFSSIAAWFFNNIPGFTQEAFAHIQDLYTHYGFVVVFTAGFTPIPYKIITISAGAFELSFPLFIIASAVGRAARFFLVAALLWKYGEPIHDFIEKHFNTFSIAFVVLLLGGFYVLKVIF